MTLYQNIKCLTPDLPSPEELLPYLIEIHKNRWYSNFGPLHKRFEKGLIHLLRKNGNSDNIFTTLTSSGTMALEISLTALRLKPKANVLVPSLTFPAPANAILAHNLTPLICDVDPENWQLTPEIAYDLVKKYPIAAVMPVATFGVPIETAGWDQFVKETNIPVIIDAAGAFPFQKIGQKTITTFSFHATKAFGIGEGGGVFLKNEILNERIKQSTNFGFNKGLIENIGYNAKLSEFHAAVGLAQLKRWKNIRSKRVAVDSFYNKLLTSHPTMLQKQLYLKKIIPSLKVVKVNSSIISSQSIKSISQQLFDQGVENRHWYSPPLHRIPIFVKQGIIATKPNITSLEVTDELTSSLLGLPFHTFLNQQDITNLVTSLTDILGNRKTLEIFNDKK